MSSICVDQLRALAPHIAQRPQPRRVDVRVSDGGDGVRAEVDSRLACGRRLPRHELELVQDE